MEISLILKISEGKYNELIVFDRTDIAFFFFPVFSDNRVVITEGESWVFWAWPRCQVSKLILCFHSNLIAETLGSKKAIILQNHGILSGKFILRIDYRIATNTSLLHSRWKCWFSCRLGEYHLIFALEYFSLIVFHFDYYSILCVSISSPFWLFPCVVKFQN